MWYVMANIYIYISVILGLLAGACRVVHSVEITAVNLDHVRRGDLVQLECAGEGSLEWVWQGDRILRNSSTFTLTHNTLVITSVSHDLVGEDKPYTCTNGTHNSSISIIFQDMDNDQHSVDVQSIVIGCIIGVGGAIAFIMLIVLAVLCSCYSKDKVSDMDHLEYTEYEEIVPQLNLEKIAQLDASTRAKIDLPFLARLTNTDPSVLVGLEYEPDQPSSQKGAAGDGGVGRSRSLSGSMRSLTPSLSQSIGLKPHTLTMSTTPIRRVNTVNDFNQCATLLSKPIGGRLTELKRSSLAHPYSTSQPTIEQCMSTGDEEDMRTGLLHILSLVQQSQKDNQK